MRGERSSWRRQWGLGPQVGGGDDERGTVRGMKAQVTGKGWTGTGGFVVGAHSLGGGPPTPDGEVAGGDPKREERGGATTPKRVPRRAGGNRGSSEGGERATEQGSGEGALGEEAEVLEPRGDKGGDRTPDVGLMLLDRTETK